MISFRSSTLRKVCSYFFSNGSAEICAEEAAAMFGDSPGHIEKILVNLESERIINSRRRGRKRYYRAAPDTLFYQHYKLIFSKRFAVDEVLEGAVGKIRGITACHAFGPYMRMKGDVDLVLVGNHEPSSAERMLRNIQDYIGRKINILNFTPRQFSRDVVVRTVLDKESVQLV